MADDPKDVVVSAWHAGQISYVEALRRLVDFGVRLDTATKQLAAETSAATESGNGLPRS